MEQDKTKSAVEQFLTGTDDQTMFPPVESPLDTPLEQKEEEVEVKPLPFHKDPKVLKFIEKEVSKRISREEAAPQTRTETEDEFKDVMAAMTEAIGNDTPQKIKALTAYENALRTLDKRAIANTQNYIEEIQQEEQRADKEAEDELESAFEAIEENYDVDLLSSRGDKLRTEFVTFVERIAPKDRNGEIIDYPDMNSAWETFSEIKRSTQQPNRAKELASRGMRRSSEAAAVAPQKRVDWQAVEEYMDTLK